jgi:hypothetical protein
VTDPTPKERHIAADLHGVLAALGHADVSPARVGKVLARLLKHRNHHDTHIVMRRATDPLTEVVAEVEAAACEVEAADAEVGRQIANGTHELSPLALLGNGEYRKAVMP